LVEGERERERRRRRKKEKKNAWEEEKAGRKKEKNEKTKKRKKKEKRKEEKKEKKKKKKKKKKSLVELSVKSTSERQGALGLGCGRVREGESFGRTRRKVIAPPTKKPLKPRDGWGGLLLYALFFQKTHPPSPSRTLTRTLTTNAPYVDTNAPYVVC
jgi:hypothetical protein